MSIDRPAVVKNVYDTLAAIPFGPLDWAGPDFLQWYLMTAIGAVATAFLLRHILWPDDPEVPETFGYFEVACLKGNWKLAVNSVLAKLVASKHATAVVVGTKTQFMLSQTGAAAKSEVARRTRRDGYDADVGLFLRERFIRRSRRR